MIFRFGGKEKNFICVKILHRIPKEQAHFHADLAAQIEVESGGFSTCVNKPIESRLLPHFQIGLQSLYEKLSGEVKFFTHDFQSQWCEFSLRGDGYGHIFVKGRIADGELVLADSDLVGNILEFHFEIDQTQLPDAIKSLNEIIETLSLR